MFPWVPPISGQMSITSCRATKKISLWVIIVQPPSDLCTLPVPSVLTLAFSSLYFWKQKKCNVGRYFQYVSTAPVLDI